jgi:hypothetical protein
MERWSGCVSVPIPARQHRSPWWLKLIPCSLASAAVLDHRQAVGLFIGAAASATLGLLFELLNPPQPATTHETTVHGEVTVPASYWLKFPHNNTAYPKDLGRAIPYIRLETPSFTQHQ